MPNLPNFRRQAMGDVVPAMLEPGEFVINRKAVNALGVDNLEVLNDAGGAHSAIDELIASATVANSLQNAKPPHFQQGGQVRGYQEGGPAGYPIPDLSEFTMNRYADVPGLEEFTMNRFVESLASKGERGLQDYYQGIEAGAARGEFAPSIQGRGGREFSVVPETPQRNWQISGPEYPGEWQVSGPGYQQGGKIENEKKPKKTLDQLLLELQLMETHGSDKDKIPKGSPLEPVFSAMGKYPHHPKYLIDGEWVSGNPDMDDSTMMNAPMRMMFYTPDKGWVGMETILGYDEYQSYKNIDKQSLKKEIGFKSPKSGNNYQEGGQVYQGPPYEPSEADFGRQVNPFTGEEMNIAEDKKRMALQMLKSLGVGKGQRIDSDARDSLMGMSDDRRIIPPLPPDEYVMRQENGGMYMSKQQVPKLSPAYMASFGMETPLSKRQRSLLQRRAINPKSMSPQLHGLLGKVLLQRLENEPE